VGTVCMPFAGHASGRNHPGVNSHRADVFAFDTQSSMGKPVVAIHSSSAARRHIAKGSFGLEPRENLPTQGRCRAGAAEVHLLSAGAALSRRQNAANLCAAIGPPRHRSAMFPRLVRNSSTLAFLAQPLDDRGYEHT
jgi:hypothetical protein